MKFKPFSRKQLKVLSWWKVDGIKDKYDAVIADGSVRSGKTVSMSISFVFGQWQHSLTVTLLFVVKP